MHTSKLSVLTLVLVTACAAPADAPSEATPFSETTDVQGLMITVVEPAADVYWDAVGTILDIDEGEIDMRPETPEEWEAVRNAAYVIAESGNLLMTPGRAVDDPAWMPMARALVDVGRVAIAAAEANDVDGVFDAGAEVYQVCTNCHAAFALETLRPNDERGN